MTNRVLLICDTDTEYGLHLQNYLIKKECSMEIMVCTNPDMYCDELRNKSVAILIISSEFHERILNILNISGDHLELNAERILFITDDLEKENKDTVYRYRSAENILIHLNEDLKASSIIHRSINDNLSSKRLIGVYSPVSHSLKTTFSIALGQILSEKEQVLYINLEEFSGLFRLFNLSREYSLTDFIYEYSINPSGIRENISKYVKKVEALNILCPSCSIFEIQEIEARIWLEVIGSILSLNIYDSVILDLSGSVRGLSDILNVCSDIYVPLRKDIISVSKLKDFENSIERLPNADSIKQKIKKIKFPHFDDINGSMYDLCHSQLGRYIKRSFVNG